MTVSYTLALAGLGNVGRSLVEILVSQADLLRERYGVAFRVVAAADSSGAALDPQGLDLAALLAAKRAGQGAATLAGAGRPGLGGAELLAQAGADVLLESTPVNLKTGQPGLDLARAALGRGMHVVIANKGPMVLAYQELASLSDLSSAGSRPPSPGDDTQLNTQHSTLKTPKLRFSACVGGYLPTVNLGWRDLRGARVTRFEAVLNGTTQIILRAMEQGGSYADALADAQRRGLAETDPSLDVEGWDAANKLVIVANAVLGRPATLDDVDVTGITRLQRDDLQSALGYGRRTVLLCLAEPEGDSFRLSVRPTALPLEHPLARMSADEMGLVYYTDIGGRLTATTHERGPGPTAAAMLRDLLDVVG
ncbi:MAG TPA: homoserine dehydrogenase [Roseiflexaceae bacterium]|nr:homoserine dehydrogenase [Roseiflexaceae bacterium]